MAEEVHETPVSQRLDSFRSVHGRPDDLLFRYGPLLALVQFNITGISLIVVALYHIYHPDPQLVTWAFGSVYAAVLVILLVEGIAIRSFLTKIPETFRLLWDGHVLEKPRDAQRFFRFLDDFERMLNSPHRLWFGILFPLLGLVFLWLSGHLPYTLKTLFGGGDLVTRLVTLAVNTLSLFIPAVGVGYAIGIGAWKSTVTGIFVRRFSRIFDLIIHPSHPDRAGGLKPLGDLIFAMAVIFIIASLALSGVTIYSDYIQFRLTASFSRILLVVVLLLSLVAFFLPLIGARERMVAQKKGQQPLLGQIARRIAELERAAHENLLQMDYHERKAIFEEIDSLVELHERTSRVPTWPFDRDILVKFVTPQLFSVFSLVGLAEPIIAAVQALFGD